MTNDLVKRPAGKSKARTTDDFIRLLRGEECNDCVNNFCTCDIIERSADLIERLQAALQSIAANTCCDKCQEAALVARAALEGKD